MERNGLLSADFAQEFEPLVSAFFILRRSMSLVRIPLFVADLSSGSLIFYLAPKVKDVCR